MYNLVGWIFVLSLVGSGCTVNKRNLTRGVESAKEPDPEESPDPTAPAVPLLARSSPSGAISTDSTPTFSVSLTGGDNFESSDIITLHEGSDCDGAAVSNDVTGETSTSLLITRNAMSEGTVSFRVKITNVDGLSSCSSSGLSYTYDATAPAAPILALSNPASSPSNDSTPTFSVTLTGGGNFSSSDIISLHEGANCSSAAVATNVTSQSGTSASITRNAMAQTTTDFRAKVTDAAGNSSCSIAAVSYQYDASAPPIPVIALSNPATSPGNDSTPTFSISLTGSVNFVASDVISLHEGANCNGAAVAGSVTSQTSGSADITRNAMGEGTANFRAKVTKANSSFTCSAAAVTYVYDNTAPAVPVIALSSPATSPGTDSTPTFSVTLTGGGNFSSSDTITLREGADCSGGAVGTLTSQSGATASISRSAMSDGDSASFRALVTDAAGNATCSSVAVTYAYDGTAPAVPVIALSSPATSPNTDSTPTFSVTLTGGGNFSASDVISLHEGANCDGATVGDDVTSQSGASANIVRDAMSEGSASFRIKVTDAAGNSTCSSAAVTYAYDVTAPAVPIIALSSPATSPANDSTPTFAVALTGGGNFSSSDVISLHEGANCNAAAVATDVTSQSGASATITRDALGSDGSVNYRAKVTDAAGNATCASVAVAYDFDGTAPAVPIIALSSPASSPATDSTPTFAVTLTGGGNFSSSDVISLHEGANCNGSAVATDVTSQSGASATITRNTMSNNDSADFRAKVTDAVGNSSCASVAVTYQYQIIDPVVTISAPSRISATKAYSIVYTLSISNATAVSLTTANVTVNVTGTVSCTKAVGGSGLSSRTVTLSNCLGEGTAGITIAAGIATETAGGSSAAAGPSTTSAIYNDGGTFTYDAAYAQVAVSLSGTATDQTTAGVNSMGKGDFDGDGDMDFVQSIKSGGLQVYFNNGVGRFSTYVTYNNSATNTKGVVVGDLEGDGDIDMIAINEAGARSVVWKNDGTGTFTQTTTLSSCTTSLATVTAAQKGAVGDLVGGDAYLDLVIVNESQNTCLYKGAAGATFISNTGIGLNITNWQLETNTAQTSDVQIGDLDGDGDKDLVVAVRLTSGTADRVYTNDNGADTFTASTLQLNGANESLCEQSILLVDINQDSRLDIIFGNRAAGCAGAGQTRYSLQASNGTFPTPTLITGSSTSSDSYEMVATDLNADTYPDLVIFNRSIQDLVRKWDPTLNSGNGDFTQFSASDLYGPTLGGSVGSYGGLVHDFNGDGLLDILSGKNDSAAAINNVFYFGSRTGFDQSTPWLDKDRTYASNSLSELPASPSTSAFALSPAMTNLSGITYDPTRDRYYVIRNNDLYIHELSPSYAVLRDIQTSGWTTGTGNDGDLEGIVYLKQTGGDSEFAIVNEIGEVYIGIIPATGSSISKASFRKVTFETSLSSATNKNLGIEGLTYDATNDVFYAVREGEATYNKIIYRFPRPSGSADVNITTLTTTSRFIFNFNGTGNITNASPTVTNVSTLAGVRVGATVTGTGIPGGTTVSAISGNTLTLSANATATTTAVALAFAGSGDISEIAYNPETGTLFLLSHLANKIIEITTAGIILGHHLIPLASGSASMQFEGMCFRYDSNGLPDRLVIVSEKDSSANAANGSLTYFNRQ